MVSAVLISFFLANVLPVVFSSSGSVAAQMLVSAPFSADVCSGLTSVNDSLSQKPPMFAPRFVATKPGSAMLAVIPVPWSLSARAYVYVVSMSFVVA